MGRTCEQSRAYKKVLKKELEVAKLQAKTAKQSRKEAQREFRQSRSEAFKYNFKRYGLPKAKLIAACKTRAYKGNYVAT